MFNSIITQPLVISQENNTNNTEYYIFLTRLLYNAAMKKGKLKEEDIVKISITAKRAGEEFDDYIKILEEIYLEKLNARRKRMKNN
jgi:hypothetical protein